VRQATQGGIYFSSKSLPYNSIAYGLSRANLLSAAWQEATMFIKRLFLVIIITAASVDLIGCRGEAATSKQNPRPQPGVSVVGSGRNTNQASLASRHTLPLHRDTPHDVFLSTYNNPEEGISIRYPRNYSLEEGDVQEHSFFLKRQEDLDAEQPGAALLATVLIPEDGYPNTTFEHGSLQLVVNEAGTEKECREISLVGSAANSAKTTTIHGVVFRWSERESETAGTRVLDRAYAGYSQGSCYEFLLTLAAEEAPDPDGFKKPADTAKIMRQLEKIVSSAQISTKSATPPAEISEEAADRL
jgi:hypothetical protein